MDKQALLTASLDAIQDEIILIIDEHRNIVYANDAYCHTIGLDRAAILGKPLLDFRPKAKIVRVLEHKQAELQVLRDTLRDDALCNLYPIMDGERAVGAISVSKPIQKVISNAEYVHKYYYEARELISPVKDLGQSITTFEDIVAADDSSLQLLTLAKRIAPKEIDVLLTGESGTGKERYAQAIHAASPRVGNHFMAINCATLRDNLLESELFGYEDGSFTGAKRGGKAGIFEAANHGTVFLDEISELDFNIQSRLLRVLQERRVRRIGGAAEIPVNIRVIAASNQRLDVCVAEGRFRKDLYYRISPFILEILPLSQRKGDIIPLLRRFLGEHENRLRGRIDVSAEAQRALLEYTWDGNVRELQNAVDYAVAVMRESTIELEDLPKRIQDLYALRNPAPSTLKQRVADFERKEILQAIQIFGDSAEGKRRAARSMGISLSTLYKKQNKSDS